MLAHHVRVARKHMNTTFDLVISAPQRDALRAKTVLLQAHEMIARLEQELSEFLPHSSVSVLNVAPVGVHVRLPESTLELLERCEHFRQISQGGFDCGVKGARKITPAFGWDRARRIGWRNGIGERLSFAAVGKGYALEHVRRIIECEGFTDFRLDAGGSSLVFSGFAAPGRSWTWGWGVERNELGEWMGLQFSHSSGEPIALGVSGIAEQGRHLIDPRTGAPVQGAQTALVAHSRAADADALSTALFVQGWETGAQCLTQTGEVPALALIDDEKKPFWNGRFQNLWGALTSLMLLPWTLFADEQIDLSDLGFEDFTPYNLTRDPLWILLPALSLALVFLHLKKPHRRKQSEKVQS